MTAQPIEPALMPARDEPETDAIDPLVLDAAREALAQPGCIVTRGRVIAFVTSGALVVLVAGERNACAIVEIDEVAR